MMEDLSEFYSASARVMSRSLIRELLKLTRTKNIISFAGGLPDPSTFPVEELKAITLVVLDPGDVVIVERPSYMAALQVFRSYRAEMVGVEQDDDGLRPELLEETLARLARSGKRVKLLYVVPDFQNPS